METTRTGCSRALHFLPSLTHIACVKVALKIFTHLPTNIVNHAFEQIENGRSATLTEVSCCCCSSLYARAKESLLFIPAHLRSAVVRAVNGMQYATENWLKWHSSIFIASNEKRVYHWKSDGTIDLIKTAEAVALMNEVNVEIRFHIACMYGLEGIIKKVYSQINNEEIFALVIAADKPMSNLGIHWLREGCQASFAQTVGKHLHPHASRVNPIPRFSSFFLVLPPEERRRFLFSLTYTTIDDLKFCLCSVTEEERKRFLEKNVLPFLLHHLRFPLQKLFLEATERMWNLMTAKDFRILTLFLLVLTQSGRKDYDYGELFEGFWKRAPAHFKQDVMSSKLLTEQIDSYRIRKLKRFAESQEEQNKKRKQVRSA